MIMMAIALIVGGLTTMFGNSFVLGIGMIIAGTFFIWKTLEMQNKICELEKKVEG